MCAKNDVNPVLRDENKRTPNDTSFHTKKMNSKFFYIFCFVEGQCLPVLMYELCKSHDTTTRVNASTFLIGRIYSLKYVPKYD